MNIDLLKLLTCVCVCHNCISTWHFILMMADSSGDDFEDSVDWINIIEKKEETIDRLREKLRRKDKELQNLYDEIKTIKAKQMRDEELATVEARKFKANVKKKDDQIIKKDEVIKDQERRIEELKDDIKRNVRKTWQFEKRAVDCEHKYSNLSEEFSCMRKRLLWLEDKE